MVDSLIHLNGAIMCAVGTKSSGPFPRVHDLLQVCLLPLKANWQINKTILPFDIRLKPLHPENFDDPQTKVNRTEWAESVVNGLDPGVAADLLEKWYERLGIGDKKICVVSHTWHIKMRFLIEWLGELTFYSIFSPDYRDLLPAALYANDRADMNVEQVKYARYQLRNLASRLDVEVTPHKEFDALAEALMITECYPKMLKQLF